MALIDVYNLAENAVFQNRISSAVAKAAYDVLNEDPGTTYHAERVTWARNAMKDPITVANYMVWTVTQDSTVQSHGISSTDAEIQNAINGNINNFAV